MMALGRKSACSKLQIDLLFVWFAPLESEAARTECAFPCRLENTRVVMWWCSRECCHRRNVKLPMSRIILCDHQIGWLVFDFVNYNTINDGGMPHPHYNILQPHFSKKCLKPALGITDPRSLETFAKCLHLLVYLHFLNSVLNITNISYICPLTSNQSPVWRIIHPSISVC